MANESKELKSIESQISKLRARENAINGAIYREKVVPVLKNAVGKTFVYRNNSYGSGGKWDVFKKVLAVVLTPKEYGIIIYQECQLDCEGHATIKTVNDWGYRNTEPFGLHSGWVPCDPSEYEVAFGKAMAQLVNPTIAVQKAESGE